MGFVSDISDRARQADAPILFYTDIKRIFRSNFIGYLHQVCLHRRVILLVEDMDGKTERLLDDPELFPGLIAQIHVGQYNSPGEGMIARHRRMSRLARELVETWRPSAVFAAGANLFEHYLRRHAKRVCGATNIGCACVIMVHQMRDAFLLMELHAADNRFYAWLPRSVRRILARSRRWLAQFVYYVVAPLATGRMPFFGVNGIYKIDDTRLRNMDVSFVFTRKEQKMLTNSGAPSSQLKVIPHPLKPGAADPIWRALGIFPSTPRDWPRILTCFLHIEKNLAFRRDDLGLIPDDLIYPSRVKVIKALADTLPDWEIRIKPHPMSEASPIYEGVRQAITDISNRIVWVSPDDPADLQIAASGALVFFPPGSAAIYTAILQRPGIPTLMVDVNRELRGDCCLGLAGVVTIDSWQELNDRLTTLANKTWSEGAHHYDGCDFETLDELISSLLHTKETH